MGHLLSLSSQYSVSVITSVFAVAFCLTIINVYFQHHFPALILFGGNWVVEISKISCAGILLGDNLLLQNLLPIF